MSTFVHQLKTEIQKVARKEIRAEIASLKKTTTNYRSQISALKRRIGELEASIKMMAKADRAQRSSKPEAETRNGQTDVRFQARGFASLRKRLNLSASQMGRLLDVSVPSIYAWESGKTKPRQAQVAAIAALRKLGKREVARRLEA